MPADEQPSITCPVCELTSYNPNDVATGYCGKCHDWTALHAYAASGMTRCGRIAGLSAATALRWADVTCPECRELLARR